VVIAANVYLHVTFYGVFPYWQCFWRHPLYR